MVEKTPLFKNLRLMDSRIKDKEAHNMECAGIEVSNLHEAKELTRALIDRHTYESVSMEWLWNEDFDHDMFIVHTFWTNEVNKNESK